MKTSIHRQPAVLKQAEAGTPIPELCQGHGMSSGQLLQMARCNDPVKTCSRHNREKLTMSTKMEEDIKRWTAKRKSTLVLDIIGGKATVSEASRQYDLSPSEVEQWVDDAKRGMENGPSR